MCLNNSKTKSWIKQAVIVYNQSQDSVMLFPIDKNKILFGFNNTDKEYI